MSPSDPASSDWRLGLMVLRVMHLSYFPIMFSISVGMRRAGMCLGSDLFGKSSRLRGINNLLATQINERQMHSLLTLLPVRTQQQLRATLEGRAKSAFDMCDG